MPFLLYSSDWLTMVAGLAGTSRRHQNECTVALGSGGDVRLLALKTGLLWSVKTISTKDPCASRRRRMMLENRVPFQKAFRRCRSKSDTTRFIMGLITLTSSHCPTSSHLLSFVYTVSTREFEVFDPNGGLQFLDEYKESGQHKKYEDFLQKYFEFDAFSAALTKFLVHDTHLVSQVHMPAAWCPVMGIQRLEERSAASAAAAADNLEAMKTDFGGYCGAWSLWWLETRMADESKSRSDAMADAMRKFEDSGVNLRDWMMAYAQKLTKDALQILGLALRMGGRSRRTARDMVFRYARAKTKCQRAQNLAYHNSSEAAQRKAKARCARANAIIDPILVEASANLWHAVTRYSKNRTVVA